MKAIITKYVLTSGIEVLEGEILGKSTFQNHHGSGGLAYYFHGEDWHKDKSSALGRVMNMVVARRDSLQKQLAELDAKADAAVKAIEAAEL